MSHVISGISGVIQDPFCFEVGCCIPMSGEYFAIMTGCTLYIIPYLLFALLERCFFCHENTDATSLYLFMLVEILLNYCQRNLANQTAGP